MTKPRKEAAAKSATVALNHMPDLKSLALKVTSGDRRALAKAITLLEGNRAEQRAAAGELLALLLPHSGQSLRLAVSGSPGVGKSSFIEFFGQLLLKRGKKLAVLAIDPSSPISGGSILGDRVRMETLSSDPRVFIRPSPAGKTLGGAARHTREAIIACEAGGYDFVIIETVGIGQSETLAASMVDAFLVLHLPNSGDELQGIKRGILELADLVAVTKADGAALPDAKLAQGQLERALMLARMPIDGEMPPWQPRVHLVSSLNGSGMEDLAQSLAAFFAHQKASKAFDEKRQHQAGTWFRTEVAAQIQDALSERAELGAMIEALSHEVEAGRLPASSAAAQVVTRIFPLPS